LRGLRCDLSWCTDILRLSPWDARNSTTIVPRFFKLVQPPRHKMIPTSHRRSIPIIQTIHPFSLTNHTGKPSLATNPTTFPRMNLVPSLPAPSKTFIFPPASRMTPAHAIRETLSASSVIAVDARTCFPSASITVGDLPSAPIRHKKSR